MISRKCQSIHCLIETQCFLEIYLRIDYILIPFQKEAIFGRAMKQVKINANRQISEKGFDQHTAGRSLIETREFSTVFGTDCGIWVKTRLHTFNI